jgi:hypothetical protein
MPRQWVPPNLAQTGAPQCNASAIPGYNTMCPLSIASPLRKECVSAELHLTTDELTPTRNATDPLPLVSFPVARQRATHNNRTSVRGRDGNHTGTGRSSRWHGG